MTTKPTVSQYLHRLPKHLAVAASIYGRRNGKSLREDAIYKIISEHPEIIRIVEEERHAAMRAALLERRQRGEGGQ